MEKESTIGRICGGVYGEWTGPRQQDTGDFTPQKHQDIMVSNDQFEWHKREFLTFDGNCPVCRDPGWGGSFKRWSYYRAIK